MRNICMADSVPWPVSHDVDTYIYNVYKVRKQVDVLHHMFINAPAVIKGRKQVEIIVSM